ncbi:MAG: hypothetical protein HY307_02750 [Arcobacter sp.]|nr:hypothetical protein [Arcobacter sp.]
MKLVVGITGASGVGLGLKFLELLPSSVEVYCVISNSAKVALKGYYSNQQTLDEMENFIIGKWFDTLEISHNLYKRWS